MRAATGFLVFCALLVASGTAAAHGVRMASVDVTEVAPGVAVTRAYGLVPGERVSARFASPCTNSPGAEGDVETTRCPASLAGRRLFVDGLGPVLPEAVVVVSLLSGERASQMVNATDPSFRVPEKRRGIVLGADYVRLGVKHILTGYDHLLFLLSLVLLLKKPRSVIAAESAFTVSHSLSFSATALGWVHVSPPAAEAAIALSLVLVALDIDRSPVPPRASAGAAIAFLFGFVHGLGFAGGLSEIGIPDYDVAFSLLGFAAGVEIGQVAFLAVLLVARPLVARATAKLRAAMARSLRRARVPIPRTPFNALFIGGIAFYWLIERLAVCFLPSS